MTVAVHTGWGLTCAWWCRPRNPHARMQGSHITQGLCEPIQGSAGDAVPLPGVLVLSASQAGTRSFKEFLSVLTPNSSQPQVWGSKDNKGEMKLKNLHLHCDCKVPGDYLKKWGSRDGNCSLVYRRENYFGDYHSCTKPSILIFKNTGE